MSTVRHRMALLSAQQHGVATLDELLRLGCHLWQVESMVRRGGLVVMHPGVYRFPQVRPSFEQDALAACRATGGVASGATAARLFRVRGFERTDVIDITVEGRRAPRLPGVIAHRTNKLESTTIGAIPVVMPAQMLLGLCAAGSRLAEGAVNDVLVRKQATLAGLVRFLRGQAASGRNGIARMRQLVEEQIIGGAPTQSWLEDRVLEAIRDAGLPEPVRQHPLEIAPGRWIKIDLAHPQHRAGVEADGRLFHTSPADRRRDAARDAAAARLGWTVERVTWLQLVEEPEAVIARIARHLRSIKRVA